MIFFKLLLWIVALKNGGFNSSLLKSEQITILTRGGNVNQKLVK